MKQILLTILCASLLAGAAFARREGNEGSLGFLSGPCSKREALYGPTDGSKDNVLVYYEYKNFYGRDSGYRVTQYGRNFVLYNDNDYAVRVGWAWPRVRRPRIWETLGG
jgi:hypothetical protein